MAPLYAVLGTLFAIPLLGERVRPSIFVAFGLAFAGTALLAGTVPTGTSPAGVLLAFAAAAMFGLYVVLARRWSAPYRLDGTLVTIANLVGRDPSCWSRPWCWTRCASSRPTRIRRRSWPC